MVGRRRYEAEHENDFFRMIDSGEKAYCVGLLMADGSIDKNSPSITIELKSEDKELLQKLTSIIGGYDVSVDRKSGYRAHRWSIFSRQMVADLNRLGIPSGKKSKICAINMQLIPKEFQRDFWRGMVDGDGSLMPFVSRDKSRKGGQSRMELKGSKANVVMFAKTLTELFGSKSKPHPTNASWCVVIGGDQMCRKVTTWLYLGAAISLTRKLKLAEVMMVKEPIHRRFDSLGKDELLRMKKELRTWKNVAKILGISKTAMYNTRKRLGIEGRVKKHEFDMETIQQLFDKFNSWRKVAEYLKITPETLYVIRKRLSENHGNDTIDGDE